MGAGSGYREQFRERARGFGPAEEEETGQDEGSAGSHYWQDVGIYRVLTPCLQSVNMDPSVEVCDAKYAPPPEPTKKPPVLDPPESWRLFMEEVRVHSASPLGKTYLS